MEHRLQEPFTKEQVKHFKAGDRVLVTGTIYTARDAAHNLWDAVRQTVTFFGISASAKGAV